MTDTPVFTVEYVGNNTFESEAAGVKFEFNESKSGFKMIWDDGLIIPFSREK